MSERETIIVRCLSELESRQRVVTIGNFDGVHRGHQHLIGRVIETAAERGCRSLIVTFEPHPTSVLRPDVLFRRLTSADEKLRLLIETGADEIAVLSFSKEFASQEPEQFLEDVNEHATPVEVFVGEGFRFGRGRTGDGATIETYGAAHGFQASVITRLEENSMVVSSSSVRHALSVGDVSSANAWLGRRYRLQGLVEHGAARGRELGFPTANLHLDRLVCLPADGIYAAYAHVVGQLPQPRQALVYIGTRPTFAGSDRVLEAYLLDFTGDLYAHELEVEFLQFIRADAEFDSAEALSEQMVRDEVAARQAFDAVGSSG